MKKILSQLKQHSETHAHDIAIRSEQKLICFEDLIDDIEQVAAQLRASSIERLGLYLDNGIDWIVIDLAAALAEVTVVPLPWFFSKSQIQHVLVTAGLDGIVSGRKDSDFGVFFNGKKTLYGDSVLLKSAQSTSQPTHRKIAKVSFTSGTTGSPKGIELDADLIGDVCQSINTLTCELGIEKHLSILPFSTLLENICGIYVPLSQGKSVFAEPSARVGLAQNLNIDPSQLAAVLKETRPDSLIVTPQLLKLLCILAEMKKIDTQSLKFVAVGGGHVGSQLIERAHRLGIPVYEGYGLTEFASVAMLNTPDHARPGSVGKPLAHVEVNLADDGEILLSNKFNPSNVVHTGDLGKMDDQGYVYISGRKKNILVLSTGRNVSPEWIEGDLHSLSCVSQCLVFGDAEPELSAFIFSDPKITSALVDAAIFELNQQLPAYARIAKWYRLSEPFTVDNGLLTSNGRPRREPVLNQSIALIEAASSFHAISPLTVKPSKLISEYTSC